MPMPRDFSLTTVDSALWLFDDRGLGDSHRLHGAILTARLHGADLPYDGQAVGVGGLAEGGVLVVEMRHLLEADEELRAGRVGVIGASHREDARLVRGAIELGLDGVAGAAGAGAFRAATLDHEALDD